MASPLHSLELPILFILVHVSIFNSSLLASDPSLTLDYYQSTCPTVFDIVRKEMECAVLSNPCNAAFTIRLHFHDYFVQWVQGCDGSILLDHTYSLLWEKTASPNVDPLDGFRIINRIKNKVESECPGIVSCADILTIAARDAVILVGGPFREVPVGRKDSIAASYDLANTNLPLADDGLLTLISKFLDQGLSVTDMVALSRSHTIGMARCANYWSRIYRDFESTSANTPMSDTLLSNLRATSPASGGGNDNVSPIGYMTPNLFDNSYYQVLLEGEGLINLDQVLYLSIFGIETKDLVVKYARDSIAFFCWNQV